jgi:hypothetical protein
LRIILLVKNTRKISYNRNPVKEHTLSKRTKPHEFANIFLPFKSKLRTGLGSFPLEKMMQWTATKAIYNADSGNSYYKGEYVPFSIDQIRKQAFLCFLYFSWVVSITKSGTPLGSSLHPGKAQFILSFLHYLMTV